MKSSQLQIRVSAKEKAELKQIARRAGQSVSDWVRSQLLSSANGHFLALTTALKVTDKVSLVLADLADFLTSLRGAELRSALSEPLPQGLSAEVANQVAAMVEWAASRQGVAAPEWTAGIAPLKEPWFASTLMNLRLHLLTHAPPPFRRRNIFVDASLGDRV